MRFGLNSNVRVGETLYHVQTESRGVGHPFVDTLVYALGQVLHRRSTSYADLLGPNGVNETPLRQRVERQHKSVVEELQSGDLIVQTPASTPQAAPVASSSSVPPTHTEPPQSNGRPVAVGAGLEARLLNASSWLVAGQACLKIEVRARGTRQPVPECAVDVEMEGACQSTRFAARTDGLGQAEVSFPMPPLEPGGGALVIRASGPGGEHRLRYQLKPKNPAAAPVTPAK